MKRLVCLFVAMILPAACTANADLNAAPANAPQQQPAFAGQTRAPAIAPQFALKSDVITTGLRDPWGLALLPDGSFLVTEKAGQLRHVTAGGRVSAPIRGIPQVDARGQGGLLDIALAPDFARSRQIWWGYAEPRQGGKTATAVATGKLSPDMSRVDGVRVIFRQQPAWESTLHYGSRLVFDRQGQLFVTTGERSLPQPRQLAQDPATHLGKVLRIDPQTGKAAAGNPHLQGALPEIWSLGHRNMQAAALDPATGTLWTVEHGPKGGDELNQPQPGRNHGWPVITYGLDYSGAAIGQGLTAQKGMEQPVYYWDPVIAPSGMAFYQGAMFPEMRGDILIGGLQAAALVRLSLKNGRVSGEQRLAPGIGRVRDVAVAPDGSIIVLVEDRNALIRLSRAP